jgi:cytochrome P450
MSGAGSARGSSRSPLGEEFLADPHTPLARLRATCPVARVPAPSGRRLWLVTRDADVRAGFVDPRLSLLANGPSPRPPSHRALDITLLDYDPPHHTRIRRLAAPALTPRRVAAYRPVAEAVAAELLDAMARRPVADLLSEFAYPFAFQVTCELFGLDRAVRADLYAWAGSVFGRPVRDVAAIRANLDRMDAFFRAEAARRAADPGRDVVSAIVTAWDRGGDVSWDEVVSLCATLLLAGYESTPQMIGMSVAELLARPGLFAALRADPSRVPAAVEELLRFTTPGPFGTVRTTTVDVTVGGAGCAGSADGMGGADGADGAGGMGGGAGGTVIPAGSRVLLSIAAANRDSARFPDPDLLDLDRRGAGGHVTFGLGPHYCLGAPLARMELAVALTAIVRGFPGIQAVTPRERLRWCGTYVNRGLAEFPVRLTDGSSRLAPRPSEAAGNGTSGPAARPHLKVTS